MSNDTSTRETDPAPSTPRPWWRRPLRLLAALLVLAGLVAGLWWWRHPTVYQSAAPTWSVGGGETYPVDSEPISIGMTWFRVPRPGEPATLHAAAPHVLVNTAEATLTFSVCQVADHGTISSVRADLHRWCSKLLPIKDTRLALTYHYPRRQVMMTITPTRPGVVRIQGMDLTYSYRHQSGPSTSVSTPGSATGDLSGD